MEQISAFGHTIDAISFRKDLIAWGNEHFRSFPWRFTRDPYRILLAEVMLHRTQAPQVVPIFELFFEKYPDFPALSHASKEELHHILYSLGLRWRVDLIIDMVQQINEQFAGKIPQEKSDLVSLPGISDYVAGAVRCFAWNMPDAIIDTNTVRITGRLFDLQVKDSSRRNALFRRLIAALVDPHDPRQFNFALLDLGAEICRNVQRPLCVQCPVQRYCLYGSKMKSMLL